MACNHSSLRINIRFNVWPTPKKNSEPDIQNTPQHFHDFPSAQVTLEAVLSLELGGGKFLFERHRKEGYVIYKGINRILSPYAMYRFIQCMYVCIYMSDVCIVYVYT